MIVGFDLDGTLDRPNVKALLLALVAAGHEVHIITGVFDEAGDWQSEEAKLAKLNRHGIPFSTGISNYSAALPRVHILHAADPSHGRDYRLADLGLRKGDLCERLGIELFIDDSATYCEMIPKMSGGTTVFQVR